MRTIIITFLCIFSIIHSVEKDGAMVMPPVPKWKPVALVPTVDEVVDRFKYYTDNNRAFVVFKFGTCVIVENGLNKEGAIVAAKEKLNKVLNFHPDMNPHNMDDGNILIEYSQPVFTVVFDEFCKAHWEEIDKNHLDGICPDEVLLGPNGPNKFDDFGKKILFGRCFMFMDATNPEVSKVILK